jgi:hypothetical protein
MSTPVSLTSLDPSVIKSANDDSSSSDVNDIDVVMPAEEITPTSIRRDQPVENEGLKLWHARRKAWTQPTANARRSAFYLPQELQSIQKMHTIYDSLIYKRRKLARPLPLPAVVSYTRHAFGKKKWHLPNTKCEYRLISLCAAGNAMVLGRKAWNHLKILIEERKKKLALLPVYNLSQHVAYSLT